MTNIPALEAVLWPILPYAGVAIGIAYLSIRYFSGKLVEQAFAKALERYRSELTQRTEGLKAELSIYAHEQTVARSRVDAQRAEAIKTVYGAMNAWIHPMSRLVTGTPVVNAENPEAEQYRYTVQAAEEAHAAGIALSDRLSENAIYFDSATYARVADTVKRSAIAVAKFLRDIREGAATGVDYEYLASIAESERQKLGSLYSSRIQPLHQDVVAEFRRLLGSESISAPRPPTE